MGIRTALRALASATLDLVAPAACLACGGPEMGRLSLCPACVRRVERWGPDACPRCAAALGPGADPSACADCEAIRPRFETALAAAPYAGFVGELIRRAKYGNDPLLAVPLAALLREALATRAPAGIDTVAAVPAHPARAAERGFHLADLLAAAAAEALALPNPFDRLVRVGDATPQAALPRTERRRAARGTVDLAPPPRLRLPWSATPHPAGRTVLVVDDVMTTGATVNECARVLRAAGARAVHVAVVARA